MKKIFFNNFKRYGLEHWYVIVYPNFYAFSILNTGKLQFLHKEKLQN